jgi:hypothetical protein
VGKLKKPENWHTCRQKQHTKHACSTPQMEKKRIAALVMMKTLTSNFLIILLREAMHPDEKGVRSGDQYHLMQPMYSFWYIVNTYGIGHTTGY